MSQPPQGSSGEDIPQGQPPQDRPPQGAPPPGSQGQPPHPRQQGYPQGPPPPWAPPPYQRSGYPQQGHPQQIYPQQGPYGPGGPGGPAPYGFVGGPQGPQGQQPYQPPAGPGDPQQPAKKRTGLFVLIGAGALALILAVVAVAVNLGHQSQGASGGSGGSTTGGTGGSGAPAAPASDAVSGFLTALAAQDAQRALSYAADPAVDTRFMTPAVLAASAKLAPMGDVQVTPTNDPDATSVDATYTLGSTPVSATFAVVKVGADWKLAQVAAPVDVSAVKDSSVPMLVNGVKTKDTSLTLLPGAYRFSTGERNYDYGKHPDVVVQSPTDAPDTSALYPGISSKGQASTLSALRSSWSGCLKSKNPKPGGCPNRWTGKYKFRNGAVTWTRRGSDPTKKPKAFPQSDQVSYQVKLDLSLKGSCTYQGRSGTCRGSITGTGVADVEVSAEKVKVRWRT